MMIGHGETIGLSGFTPAGSPKVIPPALARRAMREHEAGRAYQLRVFSGASTGETCDQCMAEADAISFRTPYITNNLLRQKVNEGKVRYTDLNLSNVATQVRQGFLGELDWGIIEVCDVEQVNGNVRIYLTAGVGIVPTICRMARKGVFLELNNLYLGKARGIHDIYELAEYPGRQPIPITQGLDHIGKPYVELPVERVRGIVEMAVPDAPRAFSPCTPVTDKIGLNVSEYLLEQMRRGLIPQGGFYLQSGVGSGANAVLAALGGNSEVPSFNIYTEVLQDAAVDMLMEGTVSAASACSLTVSKEALAKVYDNIEFFRPRLVLRPSEISNSPEVIARLGLISMNTALEVDIYGHVNSTKVLGTKMMNGLGGSADFTNSAYLSIFTCGSTAKDGKITSIVPFCSHIDHTSHFVDAIVTEYGVADLRNVPALYKAEAMIEIAHPDYRPILKEYMRLSSGRGGHAHHMLSAAFALHDTFIRKGDMRLVDWSEYIR